MNEQKQDLLAFLRDLQGVIEKHSASFYFAQGEAWAWVGTAETDARIGPPDCGECPSLAEAIERLESEITPQRETPDEDGTSCL